MTAFRRVCAALLPQTHSGSSSLILSDWSSFGFLGHCEMMSSFDEVPPPANPSSRYGFKLHTERWLLLSAVVFLNVASSMHSTIFADLRPNGNGTDTFLCESVADCSVLSSLNEYSFAVAFLLGVYPAVLCCLKLKLKKTLLTGVVLNCVGGSLRLFGTLFIFEHPTSYYLTLGGQLVIALSHPLLLCSAPAVAQTWFPAYQRTFATSFIIFSHFAGQLTSLVAVPFLTESTDTFYGQYAYCILTAIPLLLSIVAILPLCLLSRAAPATPASASADSSANLVQPGQKLFLQPAFVAQVTLFAIAFGSLKFVALWQFALLCPLGYLPHVKGAFAFLMLAAALIGTLLLSSIIDQFHKYKKVYRFAFALTTFGVGLLSWVLQKQGRVPVLLLVAVFIVSFFGIGVLGVGIELSVETVYPLHGSIVAGILLAAGYFMYILLSIGTVFTRRLVSVETFPQQSCVVGTLEDTFFDFSDSTEVVSFIACIGFLLCLLCLHTRRRRHDFESTAKLMRISVFNTIQTGTFHHKQATMQSQC